MRLPKDHKTVMALMCKHFEVAKEQTIQTLKEAAAESKLSSTLDEWTSIANKRYLNINIHTKTNATFNLGLVRIKKDCPANVMQDLYTEKLAEFGLTVNDVFAATTDAAAVMKKFAQLIRLIAGTMIHQKCCNHGIHLAVIDP